MDLKGKFGSPPKVEESGSSFAENAFFKAKAYYEWSSMPSLGDDSGLMVDCLGGAPGLYTSRFAGEGCTPDDNINKLLSVMAGCKDRGAQFVSHMCLIVEEGVHVVADGTLRGSIAYERRGRGGFGYDPVFVPDGCDKTLAELKEGTLPLKTHRILAAENLFSKDIKWRAG
ncbi:MAG: non-canonical purine NTP pyrophosphatase [Candidatus Dadabacteria bacterium]|nr:MAG: non-canonical purine NTP pyrophosphatase [Candidatus Dadabacteria bacterium]